LDALTIFSKKEGSHQFNWKKIGHGCSCFANATQRLGALIARKREKKYFIHRTRPHSAALTANMVYAFLIQSLDTPTTIWIASFFTPEGNDTMKKKRLQFIAKRVREEHSFRGRCAAMQEGIDE
jgi:hypothetical protein